MSSPKFVIYIRVSTTKQNDSGLGLEAQRKMCMDFIEREGGQCMKEFKDVESGKSRTRPGLWGAIDYCKNNSTPQEQCTLVIAKLDRLARDVEFTFAVLRTGVQIRFVDMPVVNTMILGVFATVAQYERELISSRTKGALDAIRDDISKNGGHMSKAGRWVKCLGRGKGADMSPAYTASQVVRTRNAQEWKQGSALYAFVENQILKHKPRKEIMDAALALYKKNPKIYCTRRGCPLNEGTLSRWAKEIECGM